MIPFTTYNKTYNIKKPLPELEAMFYEIETNPEKFHNEITAKQLNKELKKYRFYVAPAAGSVVNTPFTFTRTVMTVRLFADSETTRITTVIRTNPLYLLLLVLSISGLIVHLLAAKSPGNSFTYLIPYVFCIVAAVVVDRISKQILSATFERFI